MKFNNNNNCIDISNNKLSHINDWDIVFLNQLVQNDYVNCGV